MVPDFDQLYAAHFGTLSAQLYAYLGDPAPRRRT